MRGPDLGGTTRFPAEPAAAANLPGDQCCASRVEAGTAGRGSAADRPGGGNDFQRTVRVLATPWIDRKARLNGGAPLRGAARPHSFRMMKPAPARHSPEEIVTWHETVGGWGRSAA